MRKAKTKLAAELVARSPPQLPGEKGGGDGAAEAGGAEDASRRKGAASDSNTEADGHHRRAGAAAAQSVLQQHRAPAPAAGATGHREQPHSRHLCRLNSRSVSTGSRVINERQTT